MFTAAVLNPVCDPFVFRVQMLGEECKHGLLVDHPLAHPVRLSGKTHGISLFCCFTSSESKWKQFGHVLSTGHEINWFK